MGTARLAEGTNLGVRFLVELGAYASLGYWGAAGGGPTAERTTVAVAAPLIAIVVWSLLLAPKARWRLADPTAFALELSIFALAAVALASAGPRGLALAFGVVAADNTVLIRWAGHRPRAEGAGMVGGSTS
jgi:hypothetical protein